MIAYRRITLITFLAITSTLFSCTKSRQPAPDAKISLDASLGTSGTWEMLGFHRGNRVPDFLLYSTDGTPYRLYKELSKKKPTVIINASHTCDFSRANLPAMKSIMDRYQSKTNMVIVYTIDAHPSDTLSPYAENDQPWIPPNNVRDKIETPQPRTYGERVGLSRKWKAENSISAPVLVDSPDNLFWNTFGQAPNMCYIISDSGYVEYRETWFNGQKLEQELDRIAR